MGFAEYEPELPEVFEMRAKARPLSENDRRLLTKHYEFYKSLATGTRTPITDEQQHFVAVFRGEFPPITEHEHAYAHLREFLRIMAIPEGELVSVNFDLASSKPAGQSLLKTITDSMLATLTPRNRAILKLRGGCLPLSDLELRRIPSSKRKDATDVRPRSLREIAELFGVSKERIRQIQNGALKKLGLQARD